MKMRVAYKRQVPSIPTVSTASGLSGASTLVSTAAVPTGSLIADNTTVATLPVATPLTVTVSPTTSSDAATSPTSASESSASSGSIPVGTVIGACVGAFGALCAVLLLFFCLGSRRRLEKQKRGKQVNNDSGRRKSGRELWVKMEDQDNEEKYAKYAIQRTTEVSTSPSTTTDVHTAVERSITVKSAKSTKTYKSIGYGTGLGLSETFKTPELPPQLEFTDMDMGTGQGFTRTAVPSFARMHEAPISWDGETIAEGASYLSLKRSSGSMQFGHMSSPMSSSMVMSYQTPSAVETTLHRWEEAEVVSPGGAEDAYGGVDEPRDPFGGRPSQETIRKPVTQPAPATHNPFLDQNPFEDAARVPTRPVPPSPGSTGSSTSFFSTHSELTARSDAFAAIANAASQHERTASNEHAMASLIAALNISPEEAHERLGAAGMPTPRASAASAQSLGAQSHATLESKSSFDQSEVEIVVLDEGSFQRFPLPPTDIEHHNAAL